MRLDIKSKADVRFFTYYLVNGTLDFDLIHEELEEFHIDYLENNPKLFFESFCIFSNHKYRTPDINPMNSRVAQYICKTIDPEKFKRFDNFESWELDFDFNGNDFFNCLKEFAFKISFDKIDILIETENLFKEHISYGATFWETVFVIWANNLEIENGVITNQQYAISRAAQYFINYDEIEEWEYELEM